MTGRESHKAFRSETNKAKTPRYKKEYNPALYILYIYTAQLIGQFVDRKNCGRFVKELGSIIG